MGKYVLSLMLHTEISWINMYIIKQLSYFMSIIVHENFGRAFNNME